MAAIVAPLVFPVPSRDVGKKRLEGRPDSLHLRTRRGESISALHIRTSSREARMPAFTLLYSHGNAEDLGLSVPYLELVVSIVGCDVFAYEYVGYGDSTGDPTEEGCYDSIDAAYQYLVTDARVDPDSIVAFGRSLGSGPTCDLASRCKLRGVALQSPLQSGALAIGSPFLSWVGYAIDPFKNYEKVPKIECKVLVMHGVDDEVVDVSNGRGIVAACKRPASPWWIPGHGHNDMPDNECLQRLRDFLFELSVDGLVSEPVRHSGPRESYRGQVTAGELCKPAGLDGPLSPIPNSVGASRPSASADDHSGPASSASTPGIGLQGGVRPVASSFGATSERPAGLGATRYYDGIGYPGGYPGSSFRETAAGHPTRQYVSQRSAQTEMRPGIGSGQVTATSFVSSGHQQAASALCRGSTAVTTFAPFPRVPQHATGREYSSQPVLSVPVYLPAQGVIAALDL
eukprot:CAMPEP_0204370362 /NCGR_PEP_ID=MMETSP0469-20131031/45685_1 /ASSEMBLY_ACC=CAM_ASM_000384 /TAXON_ID=2969 /ORGANISM="Oxyrrhis marina" /LENGTH=457 /DNA_ID=CAMNT_0051360279 /DNA_START=35 /DNA_END=1403 /DNA_ORIENTATION=+